MNVVNKTGCFWVVMYSDPSVKRTLTLLIVLVFWGFFFLFKDYDINSDKELFPHVLRNVSSVNFFKTNALVLLITYTILRIKHIGGTADQLIKKNGDQLKGKIIAITGGYKGIGLAATKVFLKHGCEIILLCKSMEYMQRMQKMLCEEIPGAKIHCVELDLSNLKSVENCANHLLKMFPKIDILINNAGVLHRPIKYVDGIEYHFLVNYLGHFYLTHLLYKRILDSNTLVVNLSSIAHAMLRPSDVHFDYVCEDKSLNLKQTPYLYRREYNLSKLCMFDFTQELQKRFEKENTKACTIAMNPGVVKTHLFRDEKNLFHAFLRKFFLKTPFQGCQTILYVCLMDREKLAKGSYYSDCKTDVIAHFAVDEQRAQALWNLSEDILKRKKEKTEEK